MVTHLRSVHMVRGCLPQVHLQLLITVVLTKWTHTRDFEMTNCLKSSVTLDICNLSTTLGARDFYSVVSEDVSAFGQHRKFRPHARKTSGTQGTWVQDRSLKKTRPSVRGDSIYCFRSNGYNMNQSDWISSSAFCAKLETALETSLQYLGYRVHPSSSSPAPSLYFIATERRKEGVVDKRKTDVPSLHAVHIISHMVTPPIM